MNVLIGCEESGKVRDAFRARGHHAMSCDLIPSRTAPEWHYKADIVEVLRFISGWDLMILFPDCTAMALSGNRWYGKGMKWYEKRLAALKWTQDLWELAKMKSRIGCALENPAGMIWGVIGRPQYIQPYQFGHGEQKKTGILTHGLPPLKPTNEVQGREQRIWKMAPSLTRKRDRSETFDGIAEAMADQWGINEN